jgi:D-lactate dehydrogenase (cytochrome)
MHADSDSTRLEAHAPLLAELAQICGPQHVLSQGDLSAWERDWRGRSHGKALAVVRPASTQEVAQVVQACARAGVSIVPQGGNTGLVVGSTPDASGKQVVLSLQRMNQVLAIDSANLTMTVQAGCVLQHLQEAARQQGLLFALSLAAEGSCTIGGNLATNAGGTQVLRYGNARELCLGLEVVTAQGQVWGGLSGLRKDNTGYDLRDLFVGSEGTLGVITEVTLKLYPLPEAVSAAICHFPSVQAAVETTIQVIQMGVPIARCELLDANAVRAVNAQSKLGLREAPMLLMEFHGSQAGVKEQAQTVEAIAGEHGGEGFEWASSPEERTRLWTARHKAYFAGMATNPGCRTVTTDTCVPISRLAEIIDISVQEAAASGLPHYIVGHVGDGNFHLAYLVKEGDDAERATAERLSMQMVQRAIALEGTCTGEHGIGLHKMGFLLDEAGAGAVELMRQVKRALDPRNIMNPGKIFEL